MIQVAVLGYGTVGSGVVEIIEKNKEVVNKKAGEALNVKYILDLRDFPGDPYEDKVVHDFAQIVEDDEVQIICEVMGGVGAAYEFTKQALSKGKSVCTSNKELVAAHGPELLELAKANKCNYLFEASVGGGIPIIRPLNYSLTAEKIEAITGILNGTTNYILSKMENEGADF
ncbi:MAG: homoserine dehydrogenase, partial [Lachnospiraceae bacterium]|nr:homoserine dehydrogenase [Lachnospiraceae bacterium]